MTENTETKQEIKVGSLVRVKSNIEDLWRVVEIVKSERTGKVRFDCKIALDQKSCKSLTGFDAIHHEFDGSAIELD